MVFSDEDILESGPQGSRSSWNIENDRPKATGFAAKKETSAHKKYRNTGKEILSKSKYKNGRTKVLVKDGKPTK